MTTPLETSIARLQNSGTPQDTGGSIVGAGFLVMERHILTCAHVVADVLGGQGDAEEKPEGTLRLDFPLIAPGVSCTAHVVVWQPEDDIAGLELESDLPADAQAVRLITATDFWRHVTHWRRRW